MIFGNYMDYSENETLARVYVSTDDVRVPVNISLDEGSDVTLREGDLCDAVLWSNDYDVQIFASDEEYRKADTQMAPVSMIPMGTFPANPDQKDFQQYYFEDEPVEPGYLVHGRVWLYGELHRSEDQER